MRHQPLIRLVLATGLLVGFGGVLKAAEAGPSPRPHVLFILSDDQAWGDYGFMGHSEIETPALDRLAAESLLFTRGYVTAPLCRPSLASIATGLHPHRHGVTGNDPELPGVEKTWDVRAEPRYAAAFESIDARFAPSVALPERLAELGYVSLQTGKWWEGSPVETAGFTEGMTEAEDRHGGEGLRIGREGLGPIKEFVERHTDDRPVFLWYAPFLPHTPHNPPEALLEKYLPRAPTEAVARYWAMCEWFDQTCGELLDYLDARLGPENLLVVYACDNGWVQLPEEAQRYAPRSKRSPYENGVRTPIMVRWTGQIEPRRDAVHPVSTIDLVPTVLAALGRAVPEDLPGIDLTDPVAVAERGPVHGAAYRHNIQELGNPAASLKTRYIVDGFWKLIDFHDPERPSLLFELSDDPGETLDLAATYPDQVDRLEKKLDAWWRP